MRYVYLSKEIKEDRKKSVGLRFEFESNFSSINGCFIIEYISIALIALV